MQLETERLILRELIPDDFNALYEVLADSDIMQHYPYTFDEKRVRDWIDKNIIRYKTLGFGLYAVILKSSGALIGDCGITMQNINGFICPEIGYHINKKYQRQGYAKEAAKKWRDWAFEATPFKVVYSYMNADNIPSQATAMSNGMKLVCEYNNSESIATVVYAIERSEWVNCCSN